MRPERPREPNPRDRVERIRPAQRIRAARRTTRSAASLMRAAKKPKAGAAARAMPEAPASAVSQVWKRRCLGALRCAIARLLARARLFSSDAATAAVLFGPRYTDDT